MRLSQEEEEERREERREKREEERSGAMVGVTFFDRLPAIWQRKLTKTRHRPKRIPVTCIYKLKCILTERRMKNGQPAAYIGATKDLYETLKRHTHRTGKLKTAIGRSIAKHQPIGFIVEVLLECKEDELPQQEKDFIKREGTHCSQSKCFSLSRVFFCCFFSFFLLF